MRILKPVAFKTGAKLAGALLVVGMAFGAASGVDAAGHKMKSGINPAKMKVDDGLPKSLTGKPGNAKKGEKTAAHRKKGNCLACHALPIKGQADPGDIGPDLAGIGSRMSAAEMRLRIVDPKAVNPDTIMPSFYKSVGFHRVQKKWKGKTVIGAQDVEDIIAYLLTLKE